MHDKWHISRFQQLHYAGGSFVPDGEPIVVCPLPEPPVLLTGPGGDYDCPIANEELLAITECTQWTDGLLKLMGKWVNDLIEFRRTMSDAIARRR
jgi:hypothetical protein